MCPLKITTNNNINNDDVDDEDDNNSSNNCVLYSMTRAVRSKVKVITAGSCLMGPIKNKCV